MTELRLLGDVVELDGEPIARLLSDLRPSLRYRLEEALEDAADAEDRVEELEEQVEELEEQVEGLERTIAVYEKRFAMLKSGFPRGALGEATK